MKEKRILFIGAGFFQCDGIIRAKDMGYYTIAMDGNPNAAGKAVADEFIHIDILNKELVLETAKGLHIDAVASVAAEATLDSTAYVATQLNLPGYTSDMIDVSHNKDAYYALFAENLISVPLTVIYQGQESVKNLPVGKYIVKPSKGSGSRGVKIVIDPAHYDFEKYIKDYLHSDEKAIIQEFVVGKEMTIDGFVLNKQFHLLSISQEQNDESKGYTFSSELVFPPSWVTKEHLESIWNICNRIVQALNLTQDGPMHLEILKTDDDKFYVIDFSLRGGGFDLFTKIDTIISGVDALGLYLKAISGEAIKEDIPTIADFKNVVGLSFFYPDDKGYIKKIKGKELEGRHEHFYLHFLYEEGEFVKKPESGSQRLAYLISWAETREQMLAVQKEVKDKISFEVVDVL